LRLYLAHGETIHEQRSGPGIGTLTVPPLDALRAALAPWRAAHGINRVVLCGMAGARNGLREAAYLPLPAERRHWARRPLSFDADGLAIAIGAGLSRVAEGGVADVMRGEETQVFGALRVDPTLERDRHWLVLPGTHSKWVLLDDGSIVGFTTYITGELFALLKDHSSLLRAGAVAERAQPSNVRAAAMTEADKGFAGGAMAATGEGFDRGRGIEGGGGGDGIGGGGFVVGQGIEGSEDADADEGFAAGVYRSKQRSAGLAAAVFEARSAQLIHGRTRGWAAQFLSGLLIGSEIRAALEDTRDPQRATLVGDAHLTALYRRALAQYAIEAAELDGDRCAVEGLLLLANSAPEEP
jgi:2-dehydro-3-deoxygalactonokinase